MVSTKRLVMVAVAVLVAAGSSEAARPARVRQVNQQGRIAAGANTGQLNRGEVRRLEHNQREINQDVRRARADGDVTGRERARIQHEQNQQNRAIHRQKHDGQVRGANGTPVAPGEPAPGVHGAPARREARQDARIEKGVESGALNAKEAHRLSAADHALDLKLQRMLLDGKLSPAERARILAQRAALSKRIYHEKHDGQTAPTEPAPTDAAAPVTQ